MNQLTTGNLSDNNLTSKKKKQTKNNNEPLLEVGLARHNWQSE